MKPMPFYKYRVYDLRTHFSIQPGDMICCPACGSSVSVTKLDPSKAVCSDLSDPYMIAVHEFSRLYQCRSCNWWAVRESWTLCEWGKEYDFLVVATGIENWLAKINRQNSPWLQILENEHIYDNLSPLPHALGSLFAGGIRK